MKRAEEIMIPLDKYPHVPYWYSLREVIAVMERSEFEINGRQSLPRVVLVFDEQYRLLGIARRRDVLRGLEPKFLADKSLHHRKMLFDVSVDPNLSEMSYDKMLRGIKQQSERSVREVMNPTKMTVNHDDHIMKVIYELVDTNVSLIPVLKDKRVVGVVRTVEVLHEIAKLLEI
ncbi:CBS domain-containing protein [Thermodesulfobacteriota bacterium]